MLHKLDPFVRFASDLFGVSYEEDSIPIAIEGFQISSENPEYTIFLPDSTDPLNSAS